MRALLRRIRLALGRLDILCLEVFFERLVRGGVVVIDDYGYSDGCRRATDEFRDRTGVGAMLHFADYSCRYFVKGESGDPPATPH